MKVCGLHFGFLRPDAQSTLLSVVDGDIAYWKAGA
jgi:hypothetical protein